MPNIDPKNLKHGYLIIPKASLQQFIEHPENLQGDLEAFLKLLIKVNYTEMEYHSAWNKDIVCKRGESLHSYRDWSQIFHWSLGKTFRFIQRLQKEGVIEIITHKENTVLHLRVVDYERWTGFPESNKKKKKAPDENFHLFWQKYHETTQQAKRNIAKAQREWKKLTPKEQQLAIDNIEEYYYHLTNTTYTLGACNYLANKAFLNEYFN